LGPPQASVVQPLRPDSRDNFSVVPDLCVTRADISEPLQRVEGDKASVSANDEALDT
jgi:hypothetical protein